MNFFNISLFWTQNNTVSPNFENNTTNGMRYLKEIIADLNNKREEMRQGIIQTPINYIHIISELRERLSVSKRHEEVLNALLAITQHFPYIISERDSKVRLQIWDLLNENVDKIAIEKLIPAWRNGITNKTVQEKYRILEEKHHNLWINIAAYLEFLLADEHRHPFVVKFAQKESDVLNYIQMYVKNTSKKPDNTKIITLVQSLNYLRQNFQHNETKSIFNYISEYFKEFTDSCLDPLVTCFDSNTASTQSKPWILALHFYRACELIENNKISESGIELQQTIVDIDEELEQDTLQTSARSRKNSLADIFIGKHKEIPPHLYNNCLTEVINAQTERMTELVKKQPEMLAGLIRSISPVDRERPSRERPSLEYSTFFPVACRHLS